MTKYIKKHKVPYTFPTKKQPASKTMFDTIAEFDGVDPTSKEIQKINKIKKKLDNMYKKAFRCHSFGFFFYVLFFAFLVLYFVSLVLLNIGVDRTVRYVEIIYNEGRNILKDANDIATTLSETADSMYNNLLGMEGNEKTSVFTTFINGNT